MHAILPIGCAFRPGLMEGGLTTCIMSWTAGAGWEFGSQWEWEGGGGMGAVTRSEFWMVGWFVSVWVDGVMLFWWEHGRDWRGC